MAEWHIIDDNIYRTEYVKTEMQEAIIREGHSLAVTIDASYINRILRCEYHRPVIENSPFQGQTTTDEQRPMFLQVDDSEPIEIPVTNGIAEVPLEFEASGTYRLRITAGFLCEAAELEVVI